MHPYASQAKSSSSAKFKGMTGKKSGGAVHSDEAQDRKLFAKMIKDKRAEGGRVPGKAAGGRLDKVARGGVIKKNYGGALMGPGPGLMPGAIPPVGAGAIPPQAMGALPPQALMGGGGYKRGGAVKKDEGGKVTAIPFSLNKTADAIRRLGKAGIGTKEGSTEFANSRLKSHGIDPLPITGSSESRYKRGGRTKPAVNIKIISLPGGKDQATPPLPAALPVPPPGLAAAGLPPVAPGGGPPLRPPGGSPPMANRGGRISKMAMGGRAKHTGGDNGVGRLEKSAIAARRNG